MNRRMLLRLVTLSLGAILVAGIVAVLVRSLAPSDRAKVIGQYVTQLPALEVGRVHIIVVHNRPLLLLRPSAAQLRDLDLLNAHVMDSSRENWSPDLNAFVYWGLSTKFGCKLHEILQGEDPSDFQSPDRIWLGGYWDPGCEVSYDYAGRTISSYAHTYNGFTGEFPNLKRPRKVQIFGDDLVITLP